MYLCSIDKTRKVIHFLTIKMKKTLILLALMAYSFTLLAQLNAEQNSGEQTAKTDYYKELIAKIKPEEFVENDFGLETINDILTELDKLPGTLALQVPQILNNFQLVGAFSRALAFSLPLDLKSFWLVGVFSRAPAFSLPLDLKCFWLVGGVHSMA